ncbi:hypothetical protein DRQ09_09550, partial [candidate division KSB1 bacterium]
MKKYSILVVDDDVNILNLLHDMLELENFNVFTAESGFEALKKLEKNPIDLLIVDQKMPEMSGTELFKIVKDKYPDVMRIMMTGYPEIKTFKDAINEGQIYKIIIKPIRRDILSIAVRRALEHREVLLENKRLIERLKIDVIEKAAKIVESEEKYKNLVENSMEGIMELSGDGKILFANQPACKIFGYSREEFQGLFFENLLQDKDEQKNISKQLQKYGNIANHKVPLVKKNGEQITGQISIRSLKDKDGKIRSICNIIDITEELKIQEQINNSKRLAAMGKLAAVVAHEIKNPLGAISNSIGVLKKFLDLKDKDKRLMEIIIKETRRLNDIVNDFLSFAKPKKLSIKKTNLTAIVNDTVTILKKDNLFRNIDIETDIIDDFQEIYID